MQPQLVVKTQERGSYVPEARSRCRTSEPSPQILHPPANRPLSVHTGSEGPSMKVIGYNDGGEQGTCVSPICKKGLSFDSRCWRPMSVAAT